MVDLLFRGRTLVFESALSREEVTQRLQREVAPPKWQWYENRPHLFEGTFSDGRFRMVRLVRGRNSFRPMIEGQVSSGSNGARVEVTLALHPFVALFFLLLCAIAALFAVAAASESLARREASPQFVVALVLMVMVPGVLAMTALEARKATRMLAALLESEPSRPSAAPATAPG